MEERMKEQREENMFFFSASARFQVSTDLEDCRGN